MINNLSVFQKFGKYSLHFTDDDWFCLLRDYFKPDLRLLLAPHLFPDVSRCYGTLLEYNFEGCTIELKDKYGTIKLDRISNYPQDKLFISTGNFIRYEQQWIGFIDKSNCNLPYYPPEPLKGFMVPEDNCLDSYRCDENGFDYVRDYNDLNEFPSVAWDEIFHIFQQRRNIAEKYTEGSTQEGLIIRYQNEGLFVRLFEPFQTYDRRYGAPVDTYAFIPNMQLDMEKYFGCRCKIKITKTILDDLAIYGTIHYLYDQEIKKQDNIKLNIEKFCKNTLILDTCIWENAENYSYFFDILLQEAIKQEFKITILADIYTEISNHAHSDNAKKQASARIAYRTIEKFIDAHCVSIEGAALQNDLKHAKVYADASIRKFAIESAKKGYICTILTDDRDLRIRVKGSLAKLSPDQQRTVRCFSLDELYEQVSKSNGQNQPSNTYKKELYFSVYKELEQEIIRYSADPELCIRERSRLREIAHNYLLKRAEEVRHFPIEQQTEIIKKMKVELTSIIRTRKAGQNIHSAIQEAISRMGNNDRFHLLECDLNIIERIEFFR